MLFMSKTSTAPSPAFAIACCARPSRYVCSRRKSTRSSQSTCMRPGAGTEEIVNSDRATVAIFGREPIGNWTGVRHQLEIRRAGLEREQRREVAVPQAGVDQLDDDLVHHGGDGHADLHLPGGGQPQPDIPAEQLA